MSSAVRVIGCRFPSGRARPGATPIAVDFNPETLEVTLRGNHDEVGAELRKELIARLTVAGITIDECGLTHLAYATEIAGERRPS